MNKNTKDAIAAVVVVLTMVFKLFIMAATMLTLEPRVNLFAKIALIASGAVWVLGMQNINVLIHIFEK
jgi:hypothetical protein